LEEQAAPDRPQEAVQLPAGQPKDVQHWLDEVQEPVYRHGGAQWPVPSHAPVQQSRPIVQTSPVARQPETHVPPEQRRGEGPSQQSLLDEQ
jgi:hypothetical protein